MSRYFVRWIPWGSDFMFSASRLGDYLGKAAGAAEDGFRGVFLAFFLNDVLRGDTFLSGVLLRVWL